jgi:transcriptional regulator with XRE-family HTH domain
MPKNTSNEDPTDVAEHPLVSADQSDPQPVELGRRIKMLRVARSLTLKDLEERGGISATHVSEIERGKASPTVGALGRIARALGVRPATLVEPRTLPLVSVMRSAERDRHPVQWGQVAISAITQPTHGATLGGVLMKLPVARGVALAHHHEGEEWVTVLSGQVEIRIDSESHVLRAGDALHFRAERPHAYSNPASAPAVLLVASRPRLTL